MLMVECDELRKANADEDESAGRLGLAVNSTF